MNSDTGKAENVGIPEKAGEVRTVYDGAPSMMRLWIVAFIALVAVASCDSVPLTSPTGSTISISIDRSVLPLNGQAVVRAIVIESSGTPVHNGTVVTFQPSIGAVDPPSAETINGVAVSTFLAGSVSGTGVIHAYSGGARTGAGNSSSGGAEVRIGAAAAGGMSVTATPSSVSQSGGTVTISALVMDGANNPLPGVQVLFSTTTGTLSSTTGLSDANGIARTQLSTVQTATVFAIAGTAKGEIQVQVSAAPSVQITAPDAALVGVPIAVTITPQGGTGNTSPRQLSSVVVDFGDQMSETVINPTGSFGLTHIYRNPGGFIIAARTTDVAGNVGMSSKPIIVTRVVPNVAVTPSASTAAVGANVTFTIAASPATGGPPIALVRAFVNGTQVHSTTNGNSTFVRSFAAPGTYTIEVIATDTAGNEGRASTIVVVS